MRYGLRMYGWQMDVIEVKDTDVWGVVTIKGIGSITQMMPGRYEAQHFYTGQKRTYNNPVDCKYWLLSIKF